MLIIAERINSSRKSIAKAIERRDADFIRAEARSQAAAGSNYIDVNAGSFLDGEADCLSWLVETVQSAVDLPLCLDSPNPKTIGQVLPIVGKKPIINSITLEPKRMEGLLPLVVEHRTKVIGLCQAADSMAPTADDKVRLAGRLVDICAGAGVPLGDLYIDPLAYPIGTDSMSAVATLNAIEIIKKEFPGVHTVVGLTNVSYGLPSRKLVNRTFLVSAITRGLDAAIIDPTDPMLYAALKAGLLINGRDDFCMAFIEAHRAGRLN